MVFNASEYVTREALEEAIGVALGKTPDKKEATITGTNEELRRLFLAHGLSVWGCAVVASDIVEEPVVTEKVNRGVIYKSSVK